MKDKRIRYEYRKERTRRKLARRVENRPRLTVYRSLKYIYAQVIDDAGGKTLAAASSLSKDGKSGKNRDAAKKVGELLAKKALEAGVMKVAFDRGPYRYHGRIRALAEAARAAGLDF